MTDVCKYSYFNQAKWTYGDEFNIAIGQGDNAYTPLQMASYVATLGNGSKNIRSPSSRASRARDSAKEKATQIDVSESDLEHVLEGMRLVAKRGTLAGTFGSFPIAVAGKTGTAQRDGYINPKDEVAYVKSHLGSIAPGISWSQVEKTMAKMMKEDPEKYSTENEYGRCGAHQSKQQEGHLREDQSVQGYL